MKQNSRSCTCPTWAAMFISGVRRCRPTPERNMAAHVGRCWLRRRRKHGYSHWTKETCSFRAELQIYFWFAVGILLLGSVKIKMPLGGYCPLFTAKVILIPFMGWRLVEKLTRKDGNLCLGHYRQADEQTYRPITNRSLCASLYSVIQ